MKALNSRPLTYVEPEVSEQPLIPSHLITERRLATVPYPLQVTEDYDLTSITRRQEYLNLLLNHFWKRWSTEYLMNLKVFQRKKYSRNKVAEVGDVVIIHDDKPSRIKWKTGIVEELIVGEDQEVRGVKVRTLTKNGAVTYLRRPVQKIYPLEITCTQEKPTQLKGTRSEHTKKPDETDHDVKDKGRPQRRAKDQARARIKELVSDQAV